MKVMLPVRNTLGIGPLVPEISPPQPNQMPPLSRSAASTPTANPPAVAALEPDTGVTRLETTTSRLTVSAGAPSDDILPGFADLHGAIDHPHQRVGLGKVPPQFV